MFAMQVDRKVSMDILRMNVATLAKFALGKVNTKRLAESFDPAMTPLWPNIKNGRRIGKRTKQRRVKKTIIRRVHKSDVTL